MAQNKQKQDDSYWLDRGIKQEKKINDAAQQVEQKVISAYRQAQSYLTRQARNLFSRAKQRSGMDEEETRALLNQPVQPDELVELRKLADDVSNPDLQVSARKRLNGLAFKERITRAEDLKAKSFLVSKQIAAVQLNKSTEFYIDVIHDSYNEATAEAVIQQIEQVKNDSIINVWDGQQYDSKIETFKQAQKRGVPIEVWNDPKNRSNDYEFKELSTKYTKNILDSHWHGSNYSKRIWKDTEALAKRLEELFTVESMTGISEFEMAKAIAAEFDRSIGVAQRLIRTEANYMANQAKLKAWRDRGVKEYRLLVVLDLRTSDICQKKSRENKIYKISEAVVNGALGNYPPFHPLTLITTGGNMTNNLTMTWQTISTLRDFNVMGKFSVLGTKSSLVRTENYGERLLYAYETPEYLFATYGKIKTNEDGYGEVNIDPIFLETINTDSENYHVFISTYDDSNAFACNLERDRFFIKSDKPNIELSWQLVAYRKGYEDFYLETPSTNDDKTPKLLQYPLNISEMTEAKTSKLISYERVSK